MAATAGANAERSARQADVRGVERAIAKVQRQDRRLGQKRPERVAAILAALNERLDAARRLRLARDQWNLKMVAFRAYRRAMTAPLGQLSQITPGLDDIKRLAGPATPDLPRLAERASQAVAGLSRIVPPADLSAVHALVQSAAQLAVQAVRARSAAVASGAMDQAWQASSAAAGAMMLLTRATRDLDAALVPPGLR
jgi:hypothetical protein